MTEHEVIEHVRPPKSLAKKRSLYARVVATPIAYPEHIEIQVQQVDERGNRLKALYKEGPFTWTEVKLNFLVDRTYGAECEKRLKEGQPTLIAAPQAFRGTWPEKSD